MSTYSEMYSESWGISLKEAVFPAIISGLEKKGISVTMDELFNFMKMSKPNHHNGPEAPSYLGGNGTEKRPTANRSRSTKDRDGPKCTYVFTKGVKRGETCGAACSPDSDRYCKACIKKRTATGGSSASSSSGSSNSAAQDTEAVIDAVPISDTEGLYRETTRNILIQQTADTTYALGVVVSSGTEIKVRPLGSDEKIYCSHRDIVVKDEPNDRSTAEIIQKIIGLMKK